MEVEIVLENSPYVVISKITKENITYSIMPSNVIQQTLLNASYVKDPGIQSQVCEINDHKNTNHENS